MSQVDYDELNLIYKHLPEPTPLFKLDKDAVFSAHADLRRKERALDASGRPRTRKTITGGGKHYSGQSLDQLEPINLDAQGLCCDAVAKGKVLVCRIARHPVRTASVQFVVEDSNGAVANVQLFHVPARFSLLDLEDLFPMGACFAIKEPFFRSNREGHYIRIESPSDFVRLYPGSALLKALPTSFSSTHRLFGKPVDELRKIGNTAFKESRLHVAREAYTWAISISPSLSPSSDPDAKTLKATLLSNLAATKIKLSLPTGAKRACLEALSLFPPSVYTSPASSLERKILFRLALSHYALENFEESETILSRLVSSATVPDKDSDKSLKRARARLVEQREGKFAIRKIFDQASDSHSLEIDIANYVAHDAIEIKDVPGKGKGLVAKRDLKRGELLLVYKPIVWAGAVGPERVWTEKEEPNPKKKMTSQSQFDRQTQYLVGLNLWTRAEDPWTVNEATAELAWKAAEEEEGIEQAVAAMWAGDEMGRTTESGSTAKDTSRLEGVVTFNGFRIEDLACAYTEDRPDSDSFNSGSTKSKPKPRVERPISPPLALYPPIVSALNHSCIPNAAYTFISNIIFLRARTDIVAGQELVDSYVDSMASFDERQEKLKKHGFVCRCVLCEEERSVGPEVRKIRARGGEIVEKTCSPKELMQFRKTLEATWGPRPPSSGVVTYRPMLYKVIRCLTQYFALGPKPDLKRAIKNGKEGLRALGVVVEESQDGNKLKLVVPPVIGGVDCFGSMLLISKMYNKTGEPVKAAAWNALATDVADAIEGKGVHEILFEDITAMMGEILEGH